jgi:hypothetical protein
MNKKVAFQKKPTPQQQDPADKWVENRSAPDPEPAPQAEPIVRMTFDLSKSLHRRFRNTCNKRDRKMTDELRAFVVRYLEENEHKEP